MTPDDIAEAAAIQDERDHRTPADLPWIQCPFATRDLYVRAFLAGAQWQQTQESPLNKVTYGEIRRADKGSD